MSPPAGGSAFKVWNMHSRLKSFLASSSGSTGTLFALIAVPLLLATGVAVDYVRLSDRQTELSSALDGAALAAATAKNASETERIEIAKSYFAKNLKDSPGTPTIDVKVTGTSIIAKADDPVPTMLMRLAGIPTMNADAQTEVMLPSAGKAEVVMVLDYSGSMTNSNKYGRMAAAAKDMVTRLAAATEPGNLKIGLVPFSAMVRTSMDSTFVSQAAAGKTWTGCTQDRIHPYNIGVSTPNASADSKWGYYDKTSENSGAYDCNAYGTKQLDIMPLTTDFTKVKQKLDAMRPLGNTNIPLGAEFGWNLLDNKAPFQEGVAYDDPLTKKYMLLLTDGVQTSSQWGPGKSRNVQMGQKNLVSLCSAMRAEGIIIFTVAYDITDKQVTTLLKQCAPGKYFEPDVGGNSINLVFSEITSQISNELVRLVR